MSSDALTHQPETLALPSETTSRLRELLEKPLSKRTEEHRTRVQGAVEELFRRLLQDSTFIAEGFLDTVEATIADIDQRLSAQTNLILHHPDFQKLEGTWRGLHHLVNSSETGADLKIKVLNISKKALADTLKKYSGTKWDRSPVFETFYNKGYGVLGGEPYAALIGDYEFDHSAPDIQLMSEISKSAAAAHAPFIAAASPSLFMLDSWQQLDKPKDLRALLEKSPDHAAWRTLRGSDDARYLGLTMPRFLSRMPYGPKTNPVDEFAFQEVTEGGKHDNFAWSNAAYVYGANLAHSFKQFGWCTQIQGVEAGGAISGLPAYTFPSEDGGVDLKCPTEIAIHMRRSAELEECGLLALEHEQNSDVAVFMGSGSVQKAAEFDSPDATANAKLSSRLPYVFAASRFAHYLVKMVYATVGKYASKDELQLWLSSWVNKYVLQVPLDRATDELKAKHPLQDAKVEVVEREGDPGAYSAKFLLVPHYKLQKVGISIRLVGKLPKK
jgi:type VI secretion system protein ImpC